MYTIDLILKNTPVSVSVQRKEAEAADTLYKEIMAAMSSVTSKVLELTCEKQEDKKVAVLSDTIVAVVVSQKSGASAAGRVPGFFSLTEAAE